MLGTALDGRGGVATVVSMLRAGGLFEREQVRYVATHADGGRGAKARAALSGLLRTLGICLFRRPQVVHVHAASNASFLRKSLLLAVARGAGCRTVFHLHGACFDRYAEQQASPLLRRWIRHTLQATSVVIALSPHWADFLRRLAPGARVIVIPNSVPLPPASRTEAEPGRIVFLGQIEPRKGIYELLEALALLAPRHPQAVLAIGGQGEVEAVRRRAEALGIADRVQFLGWLSGADKQAELARAAMFCLPSHAEGLPMAMLEAMAAGKAVVATSVGGIPHAVRDGDNGLLVAPGDVAGLAAALGSLLDDDQRRRELGARARATIARDFEAGAVIDRIADLYHELEGRTSGLARVTWLVNRLRCMSVAEIGYRVQQVAVTKLARRLDGNAAPAPLPRALALAPRGAPPLDEGERAALLRDAECILAGRVLLFADRRYDVGAPPLWNRDPETGIVAPSVFSGDIPITYRDRVGDIKHIWELNRHLHLVRLAQAWAISGDARWTAALAAQLRSWLDQCPPSIGPNWASSLELGIRLINWRLIWQLCGGEAGPLFAGADGARLKADWLASIHAHCRSITRHLSRHSSANNHLIGELAGLYVAAVTWPCWRASRGWQALAKRELEAEARAQFSRDGVNREQALAYHVFACEFLFLAGLLGQACGDPFAPGYWTVLQRALRFLRSVTDAGGHVPRIGDADDGAVFRLDAAGNGRAAQLLALGDAVFGGGTDAPGVRWLLHTLPGPRPDTGTREAATGWCFPDGGYLLFGSGFGTPREIKGVLDCGPLGYLGIAAHGHADALALTLSVAGEECLIDPGTYSYWQAKKWRDYFRGTAAHNTVRVDRLDQSVSGGRFMWLRKALATIERMPQSPQDFDFRGSHDGYRRLADPARHVRSVRFDGAGGTLVVRDEVTARRPHQVELFWHFAPALDVRLAGSELVARGKAFTLQLQVSGAGLQLELVRGAEHPPLGWASRSYESKEPCDVLRITAVSSAVPVECRFTINLL
nr:heparinase II/III family protein [Massilia terrae]